MIAKLLDLVMRLAARPRTPAHRPRRAAVRGARHDPRDAGRRITSVRHGSRA